MSAAIFSDHPEVCIDLVSLYEETYIPLVKKEKENASLFNISIPVRPGSHLFHA